MNSHDHPCTRRVVCCRYWLGCGLPIQGHAYETPTYLITSGQNWHLLVFADEQWRDEGLAAYAYRWNADHIFELPSMKDVTASWGGKQ